jgi:hypothetical protein
MAMNASTRFSSRHPRDTWRRGISTACSIDFALCRSLPEQHGVTPPEAHADEAGGQRTDRSPERPGNETEATSSGRTRNRSVP